MMKWTLFIFIWLAAGSVAAQSEVQPEKRGGVPDSLKTSRRIDPSRVDVSFIRMPDLGLPRPNLKLDLPSPVPDYNRLLQMNNNVTYSRVLTNALSPFYPGFASPFGLFSDSQYLQMSSFRLNNGVRINMYGDYNADGWKVANPSALPWEKNNFRGAFEVKSADGAFGFRIGVQRGY